MPATMKVSYALSPATLEQIKELALLWGFNERNKMPKSRVVSECIDYAWRAANEGRLGKGGAR